jgi:hypothetical protein
MKKEESKISLENLQIKSLDKAIKLIEALTIIEEECGIHEVRIEFKGCFICPWIDVDNIPVTPMGELIGGLITELRGKS